LKALAFALAGITVGASVVARMIDFKGWLRSQSAVPHGRSGRIVAKTMPVFHSLFYGPAAERLELHRDDILLDVACGSGVLLDRHARGVQHVAGIDLSDIQIDLARRRLQGRIADGSAEIIAGDATHLPWEDGTFTAASCVGSLDFFTDPDAAVEEIYRVLRPGGRVVLTYGVDDRNEKAVAQAASWGLHQPTENEVRLLIEGVGFVLDEISYLDGDSPVRFVHATKPA
jgi:ubiquinone/menaquinone biosynthesis C-methylase UbiE